MRLLKSLRAVRRFTTVQIEKKLIRPKVIGSALFGSGLALLTYYLLDRNNFKVEQSKDVDIAPSLSLKKLSDETFETEDDLIVFMVSSESDHDKVHGIISQTVQGMQSMGPHSLITKAKKFYTYPQDDTSRPPTGVMLVLYKGQRKHKELLTLAGPTDEQLDAWEEFMHPVYDARSSAELTGHSPVTEISGKDFKSEVLSSSRPVLLQLYEKSCFLCFLMRPLVNSVARILKEQGVPVDIKRLDIDENDFPVGCPVARGTPTFVFYDRQPIEKKVSLRAGMDKAAPKEKSLLSAELMEGVKWEQFRPSDFVNKLLESVEIPEKCKKDISLLPDLLTERFQLFSTIVMWQTEMEKMQRVMSGNKQITADEDKELFNAQVSLAMVEDSRRFDDLGSNITYLRQEAKNAEMDALLVAQSLGEKVMRND